MAPSLHLHFFSQFIVTTFQSPGHTQAHLSPCHHSVLWLLSLYVLPPAAGVPSGAPQQERWHGLLHAQVLQTHPGLGQVEATTVRNAVLGSEGPCAKECPDTPLPHSESPEFLLEGWTAQWEHDISVTALTACCGSVAVSTSTWPGWVGSALTQHFKRLGKKIIEKI